MEFVDPPQVTSWNCLLYGPPKSGKTKAGTTAPGPVALLNADLPNATWYAHHTAQRGKLKEIDYKGFATLVEIQTLINADKFGFPTIQIDTVNDLYRLVLDEFSQRAVSPSLPTYLATQTHLERFFRALCKAPNVNAVFVAHELPSGDDVLPATGTTNPALGQKLMGMVDVIGYTGLTDDGAYKAQLVSGKGRRGGDRFDCLGVSRELNLTEWFDLLVAATATTNSAKGAEKEKTA